VPGVHAWPLLQVLVVSIDVAMSQVGVPQSDPVAE
jgi:hypothetical protein